MGGASIVIEAGAGTGKTSTLKLLAGSTFNRGQYLAFNKAIVAESAAKFPENVTCNTAHSLAFRSVGHRYKHRLNGARQRGSEMAQILGLKSFQVRTSERDTRTLSAATLAGLVMRGIEEFCKTAATQVLRQHLPPVIGVGDQGNQQVGEYLEPFLRKAWVDLLNTKGLLRFQHDHYLKAWQLGSPRIDADFILFDEAQDANPVMTAVVTAQKNAQLVFVGDSCQQIYAFTGAVNALAGLKTDHRIYLTQSFRFGPAVAEVANVILEQLEAPLRLTGTESIASVVCSGGQPDAILTRTNAGSITRLIAARAAGRHPHLVGEGKEMLAFARAVRDLKSGQGTEHPDLACFASWSEVVEYTRYDQQGEELALNVRLVESFGVPAIIAAIESLTSEAIADLVISTAHKSKGREWDSVELAGDFVRRTPDDELKPPEPEELRLLYVAVTRAKLQLNIDAVTPLIYGE